MIYFITGITGFLGKQLTGALLADPSTSRVVGLSRDEHKIASMRQQFRDPRLDVYCGDVRDESRLSDALGVFPDVVIHGAAMKRVESCEADPDEAFKTNVLGTRNVVRAARAANVRKVIVVSSDKATSAETCYGKTKAMAEEIALGQNAYRGSSPTKVSVVRYGNVLGSTGSFLDALWAARHTGAAVNLTDRECTRFWWGVEDAVAFIRDVLEVMDGAEIFVPKLPSSKVADLARAVAPQSAQFQTGMRGLEKLHEVMISEAESRCAYELPDWYVLYPKLSQWWSARPPAGAVKVPDGFTFTSHQQPRSVRFELQESQRCESASSV